MTKFMTLRRGEKSTQYSAVAAEITAEITAGILPFSLSLSATPGVKS